MKYKKLQYALCAILLSVIYVPFVSRPTSALTYSSATDIQFTFNSVISVSLSSPNLVVSDLAPGEASDSNIVTIGASTNASMGYQLSATVGQKNGTDALVNTVSSSNTFANLTSTKATLANFSDNTWGYSYCADTSTNCGTSGSATWVSGSKGSTTAGYAGLPLDNNDNTADRGQGGVLLLNTSGPEDTVQSVQFKIGAKASSGQASGDYTNTINFYAVANPEPQLGPVACVGGRVCYNANALDNVDGTMSRATQVIASDGATITLLNSNYSRTGYGFAGWNTAYDYSGSFYGPNESITAPSGSIANGLSLYAVWVRSAGSMQSDASAVCKSLVQATVTGPKNLSSISALTDERDGNTYAIAKLADGKCWMIENLRLDNTATLTTANTNDPLNNGTTVTLKHNYIDSIAYNTLSPSSSVAYDESTAPDGWCVEATVACNDQSRLRTDNISNRALNPTSNSDALYYHGNYYNWYSATAGRGTYGFATKNNSTTGDLCPVGWRLPKGGDKTRIESYNDNDFWNLIVNALNGGVLPTVYDENPVYSYFQSEESVPVDALLRTYPNNFVYSGYVNGAALGTRGRHGYYWTSTTYSDEGAYYLYFYDHYVYPGTMGTRKHYGFAIRCMASTDS